MPKHLTFDPATLSNFPKKEKKNTYFKGLSIKSQSIFTVPELRVCTLSLRFLQMTNLTQTVHVKSHLSLHSPFFMLVFCAWIKHLFLSLIWVFLNYEMNKHSLLNELQNIFCSTCSHLVHVLAGTIISITNAKKLAKVETRLLMIEYVSCREEGDTILYSLRAKQSIKKTPFSINILGCCPNKQRNPYFHRYLNRG